MIDFKGKILWKSSQSDNVKADVSKKIRSIIKSELGQFDLSATVLKVSSEKDTKFEKLFFFSKPKDLKLLQPDIKIRKISPTEIEISTDKLAKDIYLIGDTHFSDNFFDLLPGTSKRITLSKPLEKYRGDESLGGDKEVKYILKKLFQTVMNFRKVDLPTLQVLKTCKVLYWKVSLEILPKKYKFYPSNSKNQP